MIVLIVDDQFINRYLLEKLLQGYGFDVVVAEDGFDALEKVKTNGIDLIISDILLPRMDGFQFCRNIKTNPVYMHIPFIFYTAAYTEKKDRDFAESLGADRYIVKPTDPLEFISIIRDLLSDYPHVSHKKPELLNIEEGDYLAEHNQRLIRQLEKKLFELEELNRNLQRSEERYKNLFENANDAIILHEISPNGNLGKICEINEVACTRLGYTRDELIGTNIA
ncbi:MAG: response regulator, partial [Methanobacteriota archaeon]